MADAEAFLDQAVVGLDHVVVVVLRELGAQAVGGLRRFAVADRVREDDVILRGVEGLALAEQLAAEGGAEHAGGGAGGAVQHQDGLSAGLADGGVGELQLGHDLAGVELEVARGPGAFLRRGEVGGQGCDRHQHQHQHGGARRPSLTNDHGILPDATHAAERGTVSRPSVAPDRGLHDILPLKRRPQAAPRPDLGEPVRGRCAGGTWTSSARRIGYAPVQQIELILADLGRPRYRAALSMVDGESGEKAVGCGGCFADSRLFGMGPVATTRPATKRPRSKKARNKRARNKRAKRRLANRLVAIGQYFGLLATGLRPRRKRQAQGSVCQVLQGTEGRLRVRARDFQARERPGRGSHLHRAE